MKKFLCLILTLAMMLTVFPITALAYGETSEFEFAVTVPETIVEGRTYGYDDSTGVTLKAVQGNTTAYNHVLIQIAITAQPEGSNPQILATDTDSAEWNLAQIGVWGPPAGFPITADYTATTPLKLIFDKAGEYSANFKLINLDDNNAVICESSKTITVVPEYDIAINSNNEYGTVTAMVNSAEVTKAAPGDTVTLDITPEDGYKLSSLSYVGEEDIESTQIEKSAEVYSFTMPGKAVTVTAVFAELCPAIEVGSPEPSVLYSGETTTVTYPVTVHDFTDVVNISDFYVYSDYYEYFDSIEDFNNFCYYYGYDISLQLETDDTAADDGDQHFLLKITFPGNNPFNGDTVELCLENMYAYDYEVYDDIPWPEFYFDSFVFDYENYHTVPGRIETEYYDADITWKIGDTTVTPGEIWLSGKTYRATFTVHPDNMPLMAQADYATDKFNLVGGTLIGTPTITGNASDGFTLTFTAEYTTGETDVWKPAIDVLLGEDNIMLEYVDDSASFIRSDDSQIAVFDSEDLTPEQASLIGMDAGVILSGGNSGTIFENDGSGYYSQDINTNFVDPDLKSLLDAEVAPDSYDLFDTASLYFRVKAKASGTLLFRYCFASAEMTEDPVYNDIFALFARDVSSETSFKNLAIMPKARADAPDVNITITNLRNNITGNEFNHNATSVQFVDSYFSRFSELPYNGITNLYNAAFTVEEGHTYELKLSVSDVSDCSVDSAVFLMADSFDIVPAQPSISSDYVNPKKEGHMLAIKNEDSVLTGVILVKDSDGNTLWTSEDVAPGYSVEISEAIMEQIAENGYGLYSVFFEAANKLSPATQFNIGLQKVNTPIDLSYFTFQTQESIDTNTDIQEAINLLETNGGEASFTLNEETGNLTLSLDEIILDSTADTALKLPGDITLNISGETTMKSVGTAIQLTESDAPAEISGDATLMVEAPVGIDADGDLTIGGDVVINASELGIACDELKVENGGSLTINLPEDEEAQFLNINNLDIPDDYEIIGGKIDEEGNFVPDEGATQLIIRKKAPVYYGDPTIIVPVSGDENSVNIKANANGNVATVESVNNSSLEKVIGKDVQTGTVTVDLSKLNQKITAVKLPTKTVETIAHAAAENGNDTDGLELKFTSGTLEFDAKALETMVEAAGNAYYIEIHFDNVGTTRLNNTQKAALSEMNVIQGYEAYITANGKRISDFNGGTAAVFIPYEIPEGKNPEAYSVWYIAEDGTRELQNSTYDGKLHGFIVSHFSDYVLTYDESYGEYNNCPKDTSCPIDKFTDTKNDAWWHNGIHYCVENDLMNGIADTLFDPQGETSRAMVVTILWRLNGKKSADYAMTFEDVLEGTWYTDAVRWAASEKIVEGYDTAHFGPEDPVSREQLATILYRYAKAQGQDFTEDWMFLLDYTDAADISSWANEAMHWCCMKSIINGKTGNLLDPKGNASRAEAAAMLQRFCNTLGK